MIYFLVLLIRADHKNEKMSISGRIFNTDNESDLDSLIMITRRNHIKRKNKENMRKFYYSNELNLSMEGSILCAH